MIEAEKARQRQLANLKTGDKLPLVSDGANETAEEKEEHLQIEKEKKKRKKNKKNSFSWLR
jgi:hypothetical protein